MTELFLTLGLMGILFLIMTFNKFVHQKGRHAKAEQKRVNFTKTRFKHSADK